jgi:hypothetical protein
MANESELPGLPPDYPSAVRLLREFLEQFRDIEELEGPDGAPLFLVGWAMSKGSAAVEAAYVVLEASPPDFPALEFVSKVLLHMDEMSRASKSVCQEQSRWEQEAEVRLHWAAAKDGLKLVKACYAIVAAYPEFRGPLKLLELRAKHLPEMPAVSPPTEVAPRPSDQAPDVETTSTTVRPAVAIAGREWDRAIKAMEEYAVADGRKFDPDDVTDEVAYRCLEELLKDEGNKPSQAFETWRKYVGRFRKAAGNPRRRPGPR